MAFHDPSEFQCCFCDKGISQSEEASSVVLNAVSLAKWRQGRSLLGQSYYAHAACLLANCKPSYPWEIDAVLEEEDD